MATTKTIGFLPEVFRSTANQKFLNATVDQLVTEPNFKKLNGYIGRKFAPTYKVGDNYLPEETDRRQDYQLEPCVVVTDEEKNIKFLSNYPDLLDQIQHYGGISNNHSRLFNNEIYSFDGKIDFDKLVNFSQYYWLPSGPEAVDVFSGAVDLTNTFVVERNIQDFAYNFSGFGESRNPDIILVRGGTYEFQVNQPGYQFWFQTDLGTSGRRPTQSNIDTREVYGVTNNGLDNGKVIFHVPSAGEQNYYINLPVVQSVDIATTLKFTDINSQLVTRIISEFGGIDGITSELAGKYVIFVANDTSDPSWTDYAPYARDAWGDRAYDEGDIIPSNRRKGIWQIQTEDTGNGELINLVWIQDLPLESKVIIDSGTEHANKEFYKNINGVINEAPLITAPLEYLYYNDGTDQQYSGRIRIVDVAGFDLNIADEILGKENYTSPNGVVFTNGLKVRFGTQVIQPEYADQEYYVEGVGVSIRLVKVTYLVVPEFVGTESSIPFDIYGYDEELFDETLHSSATPDYITINRSSVDLNAWSRSNRWFHTDVLTKTAEYNNKIVTFDQIQRAQRPIIEFDPDIELFNFGRVAKPDIDILDFTVTDAMIQVEGSIVDFVDVAPEDGIDDDLTFAEAASLKDGMRVIFVNDVDPIVRNKVYTVNHLDINGEIKIHLTISEDSDILPYDVIIPKAGCTVPLIPIDDPDAMYNPSSRELDMTSGHVDVPIDGVLSPNVGIVNSASFWFNGDIWVHGQQKVGTNVPPLFNIVDENSVNFNDTVVYPSSNFTGSKIFSFKEGEGENDVVLGFPVSYRNFNSIGDIEFENNFDIDTFVAISKSKSTTHKVNSGFIPKIVSRDEIKKGNTWTTKAGLSRQLQVISSVATGESNRFTIDVLPKAVENEPTIRVYVNNKALTTSQYAIISIGVTYAVEVYVTLKEKDKIDILIDSDQVSKLGYYEVPQNLDNNALNDNFLSLTLGQFRNHLTAISENTDNVIGQVPGFSNLRDLYIKDIGGSILQHSAPVLYSSMFLLNKEISFVDAIEYAAQEYTKFKNRFLESYSMVVNAGITDPRLGVDYILRKLNEVKNNENPWYYSDMVPFDQNRTLTSYVVIDQEVTEYEIETIFVDTQLSNKAILVYLDGVQLTRGQDYYFNQTRPSIVFVNPLIFDQVIDIYTFHNTDGCYIPETPTKLGLYPRFQPMEYEDATYSEPITVIRGHDGSITKTFGDIRDDLLMELELRVYNNIKVSYNPDNFDIYNYIPGNFRITEYTKTEFDRIISSSFLTWVGNNRVNFTTNEWFNSNNSWTWNYSKTRSILDNEYLPGHWRGIYRYFYDTDVPHMRPWESLGFSERPDWWIDTYGPAPYTGGNLVLWQDLEDGLIRFGDRAGTYEQYARPGLTEVIPVTETGELRSPDQFLITAFNLSDASGSFKAGDEAPVETAWRRSSDYPFALQKALALMKPALYFGLLANVQGYAPNSAVNQNLVKVSNQHLSPSDLQINGELIDGSIVRNAGYLNWIADYISNYGVDPAAKIHENIDRVKVQLGYKLAGYTDQRYLKVLAEQSSPSSTNDSIIIPDENYKVYLHKSAPVDKTVYSAVIIEKTTVGYSVTGYNVRSPFFTIIPSEPNTNQHTVSVAGATATIYNNYQKTKVAVPYGYEFRNKQQVVDFLISYERFLIFQGFDFEDYSRELVSTKNWELSVKEFLTWTQQGWTPGSILVVSPVQNLINLRTDRAVVDAIDNSPIGAKVLDVGFNIVKSSQFTVNRDGENFSLATLPEISIGLVELHLVQYEHVLVFDNETIFSDIIYKPELGNRQYRLKLIGNKTSDWFGQVNPSGFVFSGEPLVEWSTGKDYRKGDIIKYKGFPYAAIENISAADNFNFGLWRQLDKDRLKTGLLPNMSYNAKKFENMYDVDNQISDQDLNKFGTGVIGYRERKYLSDLSLNDTTQSKFYQGYIRDKGTKDAVTALTSAQFSNLTGDVTFNEEWAFRVGEYGALETNQYVEVQLDDKSYVHDPIAVALLDNGEQVTDTGVVGVYKGTLYKRPLTYKKNIFKNRDDSSTVEDDILTAGYVNLHDIDATIFDIQNYQQADGLVSGIYSGYKIWVAKDVNRDWNVYRCDETSVRVIKAEYELDNFITLTFTQSHEMVPGEVFAVVGFTPEIDSFYNVERVDAPDSVFVSITEEVEASLIDTPILEDDGALFKMRSLRVDHLSAVKEYAPKLGWLPTDKVWVDKDTTDDRWAVYQKNLPWTFKEELFIPKGEVIEGADLGYSIAIRTDGLVGVVGSPEAGPIVDNEMTLGRGVARIFAKALGKYSVPTKLELDQAGVSRFGHAVDITNDVVIVGAPESTSLTGPDLNAGKVAVYAISGQDVNLQHILNNTTADAYFGYSVSVSKDQKWLYVGAPGEDKVYVYKHVEVESSAQVILADGVAQSYALTFAPYSTEAISVSTATKTLIPNEDYVLNGNNIDFTVIPPIDTYVIRQGSFYDAVTSLTGTAGSRFGHAIKTNEDGTTLVVGAPDKTVSGVEDAGAAYVYDRYIEEFIGDGATTVFTLGLAHNATYLPAVFLDGEEVFPTMVGLTVTFATAPEVNQKIRVELNQFGNPLQELTIGSDLSFRANFGASVAIAESGKNVFVGAPGYWSEDTESSAVFRFTLAAQEFNTFLSEELLADFDTKKLKVNNRYFEIPAGTPAQTLTYLNTTVGIAGLTATDEGGYLRLTFDTTANEKFTVVSRSVGFTIKPFYLSQTIISSRPTSAAQFGSALAYVESTSTLAVSSKGGDTFERTVIDSGTVTLDGNITVINDLIPNTGTVFVFEELSNSAKTVENPTLFGIVDDLMPEGISPEDNFGQSIALTDKVMFVGANLGESRGDAIETPSVPVPETTNAGQIFFFENPDATKGWSKIREQGEKVDLESVTRMFLYDNKSQTIITSLDTFDPIKGKILGVADQDITYRTSADPASYNRGANTIVTIDEDYHWGATQIGQVWWNLDKVRYIDYEQSDLTYRIKNWGKLFPGAEVEVVEWVESSNPPAEYDGDGEVMYAEDENAYVQETTVDTTGTFVSKHYFWVKNKTSVDTLLPFRRTHISAIAELISSPSTQGISYAELIQDNAVSIVSSANYISADNTILHIDYAAIQNSNIIHNEYELVQENSDAATIPTRIVNKLIDSLTGADKVTVDADGNQRGGNPVPDQNLPAAERYGIFIRPRQTMFVNRVLAIKNFVQHVNNVFMQYPITNEFDLSQLYLVEPFPVTWDPVANENIKVANLEELFYLDVNSLLIGQRILVEEDSNFNGQWAIHEVLTDRTYYVTQTQSYSTTDYWSEEDWYDPSYDPTVKPTYTVDTIPDIAKLQLASGDVVHVKNSGAGKFIVYRVSVDNILETVGVQDGTIQLSDALWSHDTNQIGYDNDSFDSVKFDLNPAIELRNIFNAVKDDIFVDELDGRFNQLFFTMLNYIMSEQRMIDWAFKTSFVSVIHKLRKLEQFSNYIRDNQTFFEDYINEVKPYRTKIREYIISYEGLDEAYLHPTDFDLPSYYDTDFGVWRGPSGEHARDELLLETQPEYADWLANYTYHIDSVNVSFGGTGYLAPPKLTVTSGGGSGAVLEAVVGSFGEVIQVLVINPGSGYTSTPTIIANDGIVGDGQQPFIGYPVLKNNTIRSFDSSLKFDRITYSSDVKQWAANTAYKEGDIVAYAHKVYRVITDFTSGTYFTASNFTVIDHSELTNAADRVMALYTPDSDMPAKDLRRLFYGTSYEANLVDGTAFTDITDELLDTIIQGEFLDTQLGTRPEDIGIVGGAFIDVWNSHAPEELLPGLVFDTLDMKVFTVNLSSPTESPMGFRISKVMSTERRTTFDLDTTILDNDTTTIYENLTEGMWEFRRICAAATTTLAQDLLIDDEFIYVADASKLPVPGPGMPHPGVIYINGEKITYYTIDNDLNRLGQLRRGAWGTGAPMLHYSESLVVDASLDQKIPSYVSTSGNNIGRETDESTDWQFENRPLVDGITPQALFIKACPSYLPWPPGQTGIYIDPNADFARFDDNGMDPDQFEIHWITTTLQPGDIGYSAEIGADNTVVIGYTREGIAIHRYDEDPFDSYIVA